METGGEGGGKVVSGLTPPIEIQLYAWAWIDFVRHREGHVLGCWLLHAHPMFAAKVPLSIIEDATCLLRSSTTRPLHRRQKQ